MSDERNRQDQQNRSGSGNNRNDDLEVDFIVVEYDVTPDEAREAIRVCGCSTRADIDNYMRGQGRTSRSSGRQGDANRQSTSSQQSGNRNKGTGSDTGSGR
jgi:hypothetical protein